VTYAALSLAENLGAERIDLYGADFSYPRGQVYARGAYIFPFFEKQQCRLAPLEGLLSTFLYRIPLSKLGEKDRWYYETDTLRRYRERLEEKLTAMDAEVRPAPGMGALITVRQQPRQGRRDLRIFSSGPARMSAGDFLAQYREGIRGLKPMKSDLNTYLRSLEEGERLILATLLPQAAAIRRRENGLAPAEIIEGVREYCVGEIDKILNDYPR
jgi:hypothetical protein